MRVHPVRTNAGAIEPIGKRQVGVCYAMMRPARSPFTDNTACHMYLADPTEHMRPAGTLRLERGRDGSWQTPLGHEAGVGAQVPPLADAAKGQPGVQLATAA